MLLPLSGLTDGAAEDEQCTAVPASCGRVAVWTRAERGGLRLPLSGPATVQPCSIAGRRTTFLFQSHLVRSEVAMSGCGNIEMVRRLFDGVFARGD
jgi:hypothetical protein